MIARAIARMEYFPAPRTMGIGPINTTRPNESGSPYTRAETIMITMPKKVKMKPRKKIFTNGDGRDISAFVLE